MLQDDRAQALVESFAAQWLYLKNLDGITPDLRRFPDFDHNLRLAFRRETELLFAEILRQDSSVLGLIDSDFTFLNQRLATTTGSVAFQEVNFVKLTCRTIRNVVAFFATEVF